MTRFWLFVLLTIVTVFAECSLLNADYVPEKADTASSFCPFKSMSWALYFNNRFACHEMFRICIESMFLWNSPPPPHPPHPQMFGATYFCDKTKQQSVMVTLNASVCLFVNVPELKLGGSFSVGLESSVCSYLSTPVHAVIQTSRAVVFPASLCVLKLILMRIAFFTQLTFSFSPDVAFFTQQTFSFNPDMVLFT